MANVSATTLSSTSKTNHSNAGDRSTDGIVKRRNRISFVCQQCRKAKTRCDKEQPNCTRCIKNNLNCIYDIELQKKPKNPSKNAIIKRLENDVENYKTKYFALLQEKQNTPQQHPQIQPNIQTETGTGNVKKENPQQKENLQIPNLNPNNETTTPAIDDINLYNSHPSLIMNNIMKREVKPLAENYIIIQDKFLSNLFASTFLDPSKNSMITALSENTASVNLQPSVRNHILKLKGILIKQSHSEQQRDRINDFMNRILQKDATPEDESVTSNTSGTTASPHDINSKSTGVGEMIAAMSNNFEHSYLEDMCDKNSKGEYYYSDLMKTFIDEFEKFLPPYDVIISYKAHFYESIYPNLPFLDKETFEETLSFILFPAPADVKDRKISLNLGTRHLRSKLENICLLLVILKLSYISLRFNEEGSVDTSSLFINNEVLKTYPITNDAIILAEKFLVAENLCACANENIVCCLLYIWSFFVFSPEEGDFFLEHPTDILAGLITMLGATIGLHRDPRNFPQLKELIIQPSLLNHRRMLWLAVVTTTCFESCLKGRHPVFVQNLANMFVEDIHAPNCLENYLKKVKEDMGDSFNQRLYKSHEISFKRMQLSILMSDLDSMTLTFNRSFKLSEIEGLRSKIETFLDNTFPILDFKGSNNTNDWINQLTKVTTTEYSITLHSRMMGNLLLLRTSIALFLHFESLSETKFELNKILPYHYRYFLRICLDTLSLVSTFKKFFSGGYGTKYSSLTSYNVTKTAQLSLSTIMFSLLSIVMRLELAGVTLLTEYKDISQRHNANLNNKNQTGSKNSNNKNENEKNRKANNDSSDINDYSDIESRMNELIGKITTLNSLKKEFENAMETMHQLASKHLRFTYYSVFKMLAIYDVLIQRVRKGELLTGIFKMAQMENLHPKVVQGFAMILNVDLGARTTLIDDLKKRNRISNISLDELNEIYHAINVAQKQFNRPPSTNLTEEQNPSNVSFQDMNDGANLQNAAGAPSMNSMYGNSLDKLTSVASISQNIDNPLNWTGNTLSNPHSTQNSFIGGLSNMQSPANGNSSMGIINDFEIDNDGTSNVDFRGIFGGLDLFDYDFLFGS
ncbi:hypothetical protein Kpol_538p42 [Vanderwaltozyma polyspora DSM 70294]|uniref:Zn(2)-C6 fungal-type domain-containing protein n=1 Tax=Vanderwaltozyma polyspora (strain ATCC 22028 / DSM 70294 / BCRC 21397 / CBS 2163 / NBRC 10782 / NRRL Y-8283 / UCD 57-17) TaxID=436907 RepID=A7TKF5_VANPO|nr:uncharacterized protein Kpol_538p42 [Vanderwaltozyma polyspora DSM 70294]EDO17282.1 hypothetical protein Kpol_538p42 [Vanderwaltozyma polyspora DSM 70294]